MPILYESIHKLRTGNHSLTHQLFTFNEVYALFQPSFALRECACTFNRFIARAFNHHTVASRNNSKYKKAARKGSFADGHCVISYARA